MNLTDTLALLMVTAPDTVTPPPAIVVDPPVSPSTARYGGLPGVVRVSWTNGDADAYTRIYADGDSTPTFVVNPGITTLGTGLTAADAHSFTLKHYKSGNESTGVVATWTP